MVRLRFKRFQTRLTVLVLAAVIPPIVILVSLVFFQANQGLIEGAETRLQKTSEAMVQTVSGWMEMNSRALKQLVTLPGVISMDAATQKPIMEAMAAAYPHMYLVSTTDLDGVNVARNDDAEPKDYSDRDWYLGAVAGNPLTLQTLVGRTSGEPALVASMPIRDEAGAIIGVGMYATDLDVLTDQILAQLSENLVAYLVDDGGQALAHPDPSYAAELRDLSSYVPVDKMRAGFTGQLEFTDDEGTDWLAYVQPLENNWGLVVQQEASVILQPLRALQRLAAIGVLVALAVVVLLIVYTTRQAVKPIGAMTHAAQAIAAGDLDQRVPAERVDELGALATAFNTMTDRIRHLVSNLEHMVAERTEELARRAQELEASNQENERRARQVAASARIAATVASVLDRDRLLAETVNLIPSYLGHYHAGIFLLDESREWATLKAASSEGGQRMLARGHRLQVGRQGIVGHAAQTGQARIALDVGAEAIYFDNPDLPETRSEVALPLIARGQIIGVLDVQSVEESAFDEQDVATLRTMADQIAVALDNARLFEEAQTAMRQVEAVQRQLVSDAWGEVGGGFFDYRQPGAVETADGRPPEAERALAEGATVVVGERDGNQAALVAPIKLRGQVIGALGLREDNRGRVWSQDEVDLVETVADQVAQALEAARLFTETQQTAERERIIGEITGRIRAATDVDSILRTAVREMRRALGATHGVIRLGTETHLMPPRDAAEYEADALSQEGEVGQ